MSQRGPGLAIITKMVPLMLLLFPDTATALARELEFVTPHSDQLLVVGGAVAAVAVYYGGIGMADRSRKRRKKGKGVGTPAWQTSIADTLQAGTFTMSVTTVDADQTGAGACAPLTAMSPSQYMLRIACRPATIIVASRPSAEPHPPSPPSPPVLPI